MMTKVGQLASFSRGMSISVVVYAGAWSGSRAIAPFSVSVNQGMPQHPHLVVSVYHLWKQVMQNVVLQQRDNFTGWRREKSFWQIGQCRLSFP